MVGFRYRVPCAHMAAALAVCRMALVGTGWTILLAQIETTSLPLWGQYFCSGTARSFQSGGVFTCRRALTIESSLMIGCGQNHEPPENVSNFNNSNKKVSFN